MEQNSGGCCLLLPLVRFLRLPSLGKLFAHKTRKIDYKQREGRQPCHKYSLNSLYYGGIPFCVSSRNPAFSCKSCTWERMGGWGLSKRRLGDKSSPKKQPIGGFAEQSNRILPGTAHDSVQHMMGRIEISKIGLSYMIKQSAVLKFC